MLRLNSAAIGVDHGDVVLFSDFEDDGKMWRGEGPRKSSAEVVFSRPFHSKPHVQVSVSMFDVSNGSNTRLDVQAEDIASDRFQIVFRTWADTKVARIRISWTAIGELPSDDGWDLY